MAAQTVIDEDDIQGLVYSGWGELPHAAYVFATLARDAYPWLAKIYPSISSAKLHAGDPGDRVNVAISARGLIQLGVSDEALAGMAQEAKRGMHTRHRVLGDADPSQWPLGGHGELDVLVMIFTGCPERRDELVETHVAALRAHATHVQVERTCALTAREHFGFNDGVSQPFLPGRRAAPKGVEPIALGDILLGYENAYGRLPASPKVGSFDLGRNGTYLVFRKLEQHVGLFWQYLAREARALAPSDPDAQRAMTDLLAAKLVGRWRDSGASLVLAPEHDMPEHAGTNAFGYAAEDPDGLRCPIGSHVRRANPRDARDGTPEESLKVVNRHRILRRGRSYGPVLPWTEAIANGEDGESRGLYFICLQASLARGFEFIQQTWLSNPGFAGLYCEPDPIVGGDGKSEMTIPCAPLRLRLRDIPRVVTVHGGGYFLLPSMTALRYIARL